MAVLDLVRGLLEPWIFITLSLSYLPGTILDLIRNADFSTFSSWDKFSFAWFGRFWTWAGPQVRSNGEARVSPLLQGRVRSGKIVPAADAVQPGVGGTVIEIGPGSGMWVNIFGDKYIGASVGNGERTRVDKVYGIEPNPAHHAALAKRAEDAGLDGRYEVVPVGIEDITRLGLIPKESVDAIVTVLCLCSIPEPEKNIRELYTYLKPGGRWFAYEHVVAFKSQGVLMGIYQREWGMTALTSGLLNLIWPTCMGGCDLCRDTESRLREAGPWKSVDLAMPVDEPWWASTPHTYGILTK